MAGAVAVGLGYCASGSRIDELGNTAGALRVDAEGLSPGSEEERRIRAEIQKIQEERDTWGDIRCGLGVAAIAGALAVAGLYCIARKQEKNSPKSQLTAAGRKKLIGMLDTDSAPNFCALTETTRRAVVDYVVEYARKYEWRDVLTKKLIDLNENPAPLIAVIEDVARRASRGEITEFSAKSRM
jgi:hypothetical protein